MWSLLSLAEDPEKEVLFQSPANTPYEISIAAQTTDNCKQASTIVLVPIYKAK